MSSLHIMYLVKPMATIRHVLKIDVTTIQGWSPLEGVMYYT